MHHRVYEIRVIRVWMIRITGVCEIRVIRA